jgi:branched-chain amino acid transport system substrate-binding protein
MVRPFSRSAAPLPVLSVLALLALLPALAACGGEAADGTTLRVGVIFPMTGPTATYGEESWNGMLLAQQEIRAVPDGVQVPFELIQRDDKSEKTTAGSQAKNLISSERAHVILGSVASSNTLQIFQECRESGVPGITPASTNDKLIQPGDKWVSRICFKDSFQGAVLANFAWGQGWRKVAAVVDRGQDYSVGLAENFKQVFQARGGEVTFDYYVTQDTNFSNVIQNVANHGPDAIFISGYYEQAGPMIRQAKGKWEGKPIFGGDGLDSPKLVELVGDTNAEIYLSSHFAADAPDPAVQAFAKRYQERYGKPPGAMAALGYDVLFVLMDAVKRCPDPMDREKLAAAILETKGVKGITGTIDLTTPDHTPVKDAVIVKVEGGLKYFKTIPAQP